MGLHEAADYLVHQLRVAGARPERVVSDEALEILAGGTRGVPRLLNRAMHQALTLAFKAEAALVDAEAAMDALGVLGLVDEHESRAPGPSIATAVKREDHDSPQRDDCPETLLSLDEGPLSMPEPSGAHRPSASPRRPA